MKKKKTIYLRKKRKVSQNKVRKYFAKKFPKIYNSYFYSDNYKNKFRLIYSLMLFFNCVGAHKILNFFKRLGIIKNYKNFIYKKKSLKSLRLIKKFNKKKKIYKKKKRISKILKVLFIKKFLVFSNVHKIRYRNVLKKQELCLHFSYKHILFLPVRGQRTKTNAKTRKDFNIF